MNKIKRLIDESGCTRYNICKNTDILRTQVDKWYHGTVTPNLLTLKLINYISKDDEELLINIKTLLDE
jgi:predicted transcriptional regulator